MVVAVEVKIDQQQFAQLTNLLEDVWRNTDAVASYLSSLSEKIDELIGAVKAVEAAVESSHA